MYVAPGLLYLHLPRTAGTFVTNVLERTGSGSRNVPGLMPHDGVRKVGELASDRLVFGSIRDPWSWYVSFYSSFKHHKTGGLTGPLAEFCGNRATFKDALVAMTRPVGQAVVGSPKFPGHPAGVDRLGQTLLDAGIELWSWYIMTTFCLEPIETVEALSNRLDDESDLPWAVHVLVDAATIEDGLAEVLRAWNGPKIMETITMLASAPPINESPPSTSWKGVRPSGRPDPRWWDGESIRTVEEVDGFLMRRFGFDKPVGARSPVHTLERG